jgi:hypothetical protein
MSPLTAFFLGLFGVGAVGIASGAAIVLVTLSIVDSRSSDILGFADNTIGGTLKALPEFLESLPPTVDDLLKDRRAPEYASQIDVKVDFASGELSKGLRPVMAITNNGDEVVSLLAVRVAALDSRNLPIREWTEVVATPLAVCDEWRGVLYPGNTRYVVVSGWSNIRPDQADSITGVAEISQIRVWQPPEVID